jgi:hypothetical protein
MTKTMKTTQQRALQATNPIVTLNMTTIKMIKKMFFFLKKVVVVVEKIHNPLYYLRHHHQMG